MTGGTKETMKDTKISPPFIRAAALLLALTLLALAAPVFGARKSKDLPPQYKKWLDEEVVWIISKVEREAFLLLEQDNERDRYIQAFWTARDPTPGTPRNECHEEHYRRIEYANAHFGRGGEGPGWKSDRGRLYIQLGAPAQVFDWPNNYQMYPQEMWFYSLRQHPTLPNNFYLIFYQREGAGGYRLYSPYNDGPEKLVRAMRINTRAESYEYLKSVSGELAQASMTYYPNEPVDRENLTASLTSDILVAHIFKLPEDEAPNSYLTQFLPADSKLREKVRTNFSYQFVPMQAAFLPVTDVEGRNLLHYAFLIAPEDLSIARYKDQYYASLELSLSISDEKDNTLLTVRQDVVQYFSEAEFDRIKFMPFQFQDKVGIVPGSYKIDLVIFNKVTSQTHRFSKTLEIPDTPSVAPAVSPLVLVSQYRKVPAESASLAGLCFSFFGYSFQPLLEKSVHPADKLNVLYQLYYPPDKAAQEAAESLVVEYKLVAANNTGAPKVETDQVAKSKFNKMGCLLNFRQISLTDMTPGRCTLVVAVKEPSGRMLAGDNIQFTIDPAKRNPTVREYASERLQVDEAGVYCYHRGQLLLKLGRAEAALAALREAVLKSPDNTPATVELARQELGQNNAAKALEYLERVRSRKDFLAEDNLLLARVFMVSGRKEDALPLLDGFRKATTPTRKQFLELSELYQQLGQPETAAQMRASAGEEQPPVEKHTNSPGK